MAGLICNLVNTVLTGIESVATEIMAQHLRRDNIRILIEYLVDPGRCHSVRLTAHKEIRALRVANLKVFANCVYRFVIQVYGTVLIAFANDVDLFGNQVHVLQFEINTLRPTYAGVGVQGHDREVTFAATFEEPLAECLYILLLDRTRIGILNLHLHKIILQDCHFDLASGADQELVVCPQGREVVVNGFWMVPFDVSHIGNVIEHVRPKQCEGYGAEAVHTPLIINSYLVAIILRCVFRLTDAAQVLVKFFHISIASYFYYTSRGLRIQQKNYV